MQKITPFLWFNGNVAEVTNFYIDAFKGATVVEKRNAAGGMIQSATIAIDGRELILFDGGPMFTITPAISFFVNRSSPAEIDELWNKLSDGAKVLMPLNKYPFSEKYGWLQDKFGVSWQFNLTTGNSGIAPFFLFIIDGRGKAEEAIDFYTSLFKDSSSISKTYYPAGQGGVEGIVKHAIFSLAGLEFKATDSNFSHDFTFSHAVSLFVDCHTQEEVDYFWDKFLEGGSKSRCGWLQDKFGVSWQIIPNILNKYLNDPDPVKAKRVLDAMLKMDKLDIKTLQQAYDE